MDMTCCFTRLVAFREKYGQNCLVGINYEIYMFKSKENRSQSIKSKLMCLVITWVATMNVFVSGSDPVGGW